MCIYWLLNPISLSLFLPSFLHLREEKGREGEREGERERKRERERDAELYALTRDKESLVYTFMNT